eukprot:c24225_g1_i1.p1 GENE.c24225_g1_i1~~c24225_g1_i1.p1  ORF type:complete len:102 (+),score=6.96 c24225_g1_i1:130-435(+)
MQHKFLVEEYFSLAQLSFHGFSFQLVVFVPNFWKCGTRRFAPERFTGSCVKLLAWVEMIRDACCANAPQEATLVRGPDIHPISQIIHQCSTTASYHGYFSD